MNIIHLSDFHLRNEKLDIMHERVLKALLNDLEDYVNESTLLIFSGDFINAGGKDFDNPEDAFYSFRNSVFNPLLEKFPTLKNRIFFTPGNHDLTRGNISILEKSHKENMLEKPANRTEFYTHFRQNVVGMELYQAFKENFYGNYPDKNISALEDNFTLKIDGFKIGISSFNSSFLCYSDSDEGNVLLLEEQLTNSLEEVGSCNVKIAILHHPLNFYHQSEREMIKNFLEKEYDLVFIGHTHKQQSEFNQTLLGNCYFSVGKSLNSLVTESTTYTNGYSVIEFNPGITLKVNLRKYSSNGERFIANSDYGRENGVHEISVNKNLGNEKAKELRINPRFKEFLNDIGANFRHKNKSTIRLEEIYIYPNLERYDYSSSDEERNTTVNSKDIFADININDTKRVVILGDNSSGKTSFSKKVFEQIFEKENYYPIFIKGEDIKSTDTRELIKLKNTLLNDQYESEKIPTIKRPFFIIDNLNDAKLKHIYIKKFVGSLVQNNFDFLFTWDQLFTFNEIFDSLISKMEVYEIMPFGKKYRFQLLEKWTDFEIFKNEQERLNQLYEVEKLVDSIVGKNLVPAFPLYILTILQATELYPTENLEKSTLGHYYDVLIKSALGKILVKNSDIEKYYTYLSELANKMYEKESKTLSEEEFIDFHKYYVQQYNLHKNGFIEMERNLILCDIMLNNKKCYKFKYDYIYYYFLGKFLADNLEDSIIKKKIVKIADSLYNTDDANTFLFLSHHSKSEFVIQTIVNTARGIFPNIEMLNFGDDIKEIDKLITEASTTITLDITKTPREYKLNELEESDEHINSNSSISYDSEDNKNSIDTIAEINKSFKTIEILGLILKNRSASLKADPKMEIARETYFLGLRSTSLIFKTFLEGEEFIKDEIVQLISKDPSLTKSDKEELAKKFIFNMYYMTAYTIIKRVSSSVATKDLEPTFDDLRTEFKGNNAISLIDIANKLEYSSKFPFQELDNLKGQFKNNQFSFFLLKRFSLNHLRMFPMKEVEKQKICSKLDIPISTQRHIEMTSKVTKQRRNQ